MNHIAFNNIITRLKILDEILSWMRQLSQCKSQGQINQVKGEGQGNCLININKLITYL